MSILGVNKNPTASELRRFGRAMLLGFGLLGIALWLLQHIRADAPSFFSWSGSPPQLAAACCWLLGIALLAISYASARLARFVYVVWMTAASCLGLVMSTLLLTVLFVFMLPVFSLIVRRTDPLRKRIGSDDTYWEDYKPHEATIERMNRLS